MKYLHTMIRVENLETSLDFFCNKLGFEQTRKLENEQGQFTLIFLSAPGDSGRTNAPLLELTYNWPSVGEESENYTSGRNFGHVAYEVENIYDTCQKLMAAGVVINRPPRDGRMAFIMSPDNISIELLQAGDNLSLQEPWKSMANIGSW